MAMKFNGDLQVGRRIDVARRLNAGLSKETITAQRDILVNDYAILSLSNATTQDAVLPDATTLPEGWEITINVPASSTASVDVMTYDAVTPVRIQNILVGRAYTFLLIDNSTAEGEWKVNYLEKADLEPASRYVESFDATTDWGTASAGFYTITILESTHEKELQPIVRLEELDGSDYNKVEADVKVLANGNVEIKVPDTPDNRFAGRAIIM